MENTGAIEMTIFTSLMEIYLLYLWKDFDNKKLYFVHLSITSRSIEMIFYQKNVFLKKGYF